MPMTEFYDLEGNLVSYETWARIFAGENRFLVGTRIPEKGVKVSTVWIGIAWMLEVEEGGLPLIFETMVFGDGDDDFDDLASWRWPSREEALKGHENVVDGIRSGDIALHYSNDE
jgi:hypothetical protein